LGVRLLSADSTYQEISRLFANSDSAKIGVAFLRKSGLNQILGDIEGFLKKKRELHITVGISRFYITEPQALRQLLHLSKSFPKLHLYYMFWEGYHPKVFYFENKDKASIIVGSSNITGPALRANIEANVLIDDESFSPSLVLELQDFWNAFGKSQKPLVDDIVDKYDSDFENAKKPTLRTSKGKTTKLKDSDRTPPLTYVLKRRSPLDTNRPMWKISPDTEGRQWPDWKDSIIQRGNDSIGVIALGWPDIGDLTKLRPKSLGELETFIDKNRIKWKWDPNKDPSWYVAEQLWRFYRGMIRGNYVVIYSNKTLFATGEIESDYYFSGDDDGIFPHRRTIKLVYPPMEHMCRGTIVKILGKRPTLYQIDKIREKKVVMKSLV